MSAFLIAEMGASHNGSIVKALKLADAAKNAGADALKIQTFDPDLMVADKNYIIPAGPWAGRNLHELYCQTQLPWKWHEEIFGYCKHIGLECFSTPFDKKSVDFLEKLGCPRYKISSFEIVDLELILYVAQTGKPMLISTGMASMEEIRDAHMCAVEHGCSDVTLLKCTSAYPAPTSDANLATMALMLHDGIPKVGVSDHSPGSGVAIAAVMLGAVVVEKHIKLDGCTGPDSGFAMTPGEFKLMVEDVRRAEQSIGGVHFGPTKSEEASFHLRRSLYAIQDMKEGDLIVAQDICARRPTLGIHPKEFGSIVGKMLKRDVKAGEPITWDILA